MGLNLKSMEALFIDIDRMTKKNFPEDCDYKRGVQFVCELAREHIRTLRTIEVQAKQFEFLAKAMGLEPKAMGLEPTEKEK